ncbi:hypothetical protein IMZ08_21000 [Bacillus luteolus]|uniref:Uncharacterized protein n=1 Tax=Litchfieldia luteola TaxID=682179 RepID=A0ABR9QPT7_9BACI|nr:hypothetical protein [Cytobacillus luteolus]MBE4910519.1 hypothetical protein [Cytobacillus luteolus]MBP1943696.1 uncharacterized protein YacL [Cytobacillus luteolus]
MNEKQLKPLLFIKRITTVGLIIGLALAIFSFFVSGISQGYFLSVGISIMVSSMLVFGFGMFLALIEELSQNNQVNKSANAYYAKNSSR